MKKNILPPSNHLDDSLSALINNKTKPPGSLGMLEEMAHRLGRIQQTTAPTLEKPTMMVFAADHGIAGEGVSPFPQEVTYQMVLNYLSGGAAINVFTRLNKIDLKVVDAGVAARFEPHPQLIDRKIAMGTASYLKGTAMTPEQCQKAFDDGQKIISDLAGTGCNIVGFGEMGIGNTSSAALLMHLTTQIPLEFCVGRGTGLDDEGLARKQSILARALENNPQPQNAMQTMQYFGGFELAMMCGAILEAARQGMTVVIDGFIVTSCLLIAAEMEPNVLEYCIFAHCSDENGHARMLNWLGVKPLLKLGLRLGEGTGAALAFPLIHAATTFLNEMASFQSAGVSNRPDQ